MIMKIAASGIFLSLLTIVSTGHAAIIFSNCRVAKTVQTPGASVTETVDRFKPADVTNSIRSYSKDLPKALDYIAWLLTDEDEYAKLKDTDEAAQAGLFLEDYEFVSSLASEESACHDSRNQVTKALYIQPFALQLPGTPAVTNNYGIGYKVCPYLVDDERQLPLLNECVDIGRKTGYTINEIKNRNALLALHIDKTKRTANATMLGVGVLGSVGVFKIARIFKGGSLLTAGALAAIPVGTAYVLNESEYTDSLVQNVVDFRDAAQVPLTGDLTTVVKINMPMQDFLPYFQRYLDSMDSGLVPTALP